MSCEEFASFVKCQFILQGLFPDLNEIRFRNAEIARPLILTRSIFKGISSSKVIAAGLDFNPLTGNRGGIGRQRVFFKRVANFSLPGLTKLRQIRIFHC